MPGHRFSSVRRLFIKPSQVAENELTMASTENSTIASYLAALVNRIGVTQIPDQDRMIVRQHLLDAFASAWIGYRSQVFQDLAQVCPEIRKGCIWPGGGAGRGD